jgi:glycosyltransferase involved in cell wall biosynthesis
VAIGIPVYNGEDYIEETLELLLAQTFEDFEIIVSDNCSTDRSPQIVKDYAVQDDRILYTRTEQNLGATPNFNRTFLLSRSPYFTWKAHDDRPQPAYLAKCVEVLDRDPGVVLSHSASIPIDDKGEPLRFDAGRGCFIYEPGGYEVPPDQVHLAEGPDAVERFTELLDETYFGMHIYGVVRREPFARTGLYPSYFPCERCLLAKLALQGRFSTLDEPLFARRVHAKSSCFMSMADRFAYNDTADSPYRHAFPRLRAYLAAPLQSPAIGPAQRLRCVARVAAATVQSRLRRLERRRNPELATRKAVYQ